MNIQKIIENSKAVFINNTFHSGMENPFEDLFKTQEQSPKLKPMSEEDLESQTKEVVKYIQSKLPPGVVPEDIIRTIINLEIEFYTNNFGNDKSL